MSPTLRNGAFYVLDRTSYQHDTPRRGDVVVLKNQKGTFIKRVVGVGGDEITVLHQGDQVDELVMDWQVEQIERTLRGAGRRSSLQLVRRRVPPRHYYVVGDNLELSEDSRHFGLVPLHEIQGKMLGAPPINGELRHIAAVPPAPVRS